MLSRQVSSNLRVLNKARAFQFVRAFSAEAKPEDAAASVPEPTPEEIKANQHEWGIKYNDECLKFEKEWELIAAQVEKEQAVFIDSELGDLQKQKVDMLVDKVLDLNIFELRYFQMAMQHRVARSTGLNPMKINMDWPSVKQDGAGTWPPANPNWFK
jgi:hypothetical protein